MGTTMPMDRTMIAAAIADRMVELQSQLDYLSDVANSIYSIPTLELSEVIYRAEDNASDTAYELWKLARDIHPTVMEEINQFYDEMKAGVYPLHPLDRSWTITEFFLVLGGIASYLYNTHGLEVSEIPAIIETGDGFQVEMNWYLVDQYVHDYIEKYFVNFLSQ